MSTWSVVTHSATVLTGIQRPSSSVTKAHYAPADIANINSRIINDQNPTLHVWQAFGTNGVLQIPNRGILHVRGGDVVAVDINGWPIVISGQSIAAGNAWTLT